MSYKPWSSTTATPPPPLDKPVWISLDAFWPADEPITGPVADPASTTIDRTDFGVNIELPLDGGGVVVGDKVRIALEIEAVLRGAATEAEPPGSAG